jgi:hypothetical protein
VISPSVFPPKKTHIYEFLDQNNYINAFYLDLSGFSKTDSYKKGVKSLKGVAGTLPTPGIGKIDHKSMFHNQWQLFRGQTQKCLTW